MDILISLYLFILGLIFGSFILVVVDRMRLGQQWVRGRSACEYCKHTLQTKDLVPLFSWLSTSGHCRYCKKKLSLSYPLTELLLGVIFTVSYLVWPYEVSTSAEIALFITWLASLVLLCGLFVYDLRWFILPNKLVYPLIAVSAVFALLYTYSFGVFNLETLVSYLLSIFVAAGFFLLLYVLSQGKWIGDGDIRLGVAIGLFTGNWIASWLVIFTASLIGVLLVVPAIIRKNKKQILKLKVPFGPLLITGLYITVLYGQKIIEWYANEVLVL